MFSAILFAGAAWAAVLMPDRLDATGERVAALKLPPGFRLNVFARNLNDARMLANGPRGITYVTRPGANVVTCLIDADGDGAAETVKPAVTLPEVHGIAVDGLNVFLANPTEVHAGEIQGDCTIGKLKRVIAGLPGKRHHEKRTLLIGVDRKLYISVGSSCNVCKESDPRLATILRANLDGSDVKVFAKGLRNTIGFALHPDTKEMWGMDHGIDGEGDNEPGEELNLIEKDADYGWPQGSKAGRAPAIRATAHAAPIGLIFYTGSAFPADYRGDAFVAFHGSWNRVPASGYEVARVRFEKGKPVKFESFLTGFLVNDGKSQFGRPTGLAMRPDGALLVADDANGMIYRISRSKP